MKNSIIHILSLSRLGIKNWRKCLGSRGQKKRRSARPNEDLMGCQRRGLLESHGMSEAHKQAYEKYHAFVDRMHFNTQPIKTNHVDKTSGRRK